MSQVQFLLRPPNIRKEEKMSGLVLAKTGKRYTRQEWVSMDPEERELLLSRNGPAYTDEAWKKHFGNRKKNK
jgi:hypothetical protein